jgi:hypothetical protein
MGTEKLAPQWIYFQPRVEKRPTRTSFSLEGGDWTLKPFKTSAKPQFPLDNSGARPTYVPGVQRGTWEWYQWDARQMALRKTFALPQEMQNNRRLLLELGEVRHTADVYLNGKPAGRINFNQVPGELDVTDLVNRRGENEVVILLGDAETTAEALKLTTAKSTSALACFVD